MAFLNIFKILKSIASIFTSDHHNEYYDEHHYHEDHLDHPHQEEPNAPEDNISDEEGA